MIFVRIAGLVVAMLYSDLTPAFAVANPPQCRSAPVFHKNGTATFDGMLYSDRAKLKVRLQDFHKHNPNCVMTNFVLEPGTGTSVMFEAIKLLAGAGLLPEKVGFLVEPRNTP